MNLKQTLATPARSRQQFLAWYHAQGPGQLLQTIEATYLLTATKLTYNQKILQVGWLGTEKHYIDHDLRANLAIVDIDGTASPTADSVMRGDAEALPVATESIDVLVLPHVLEFEDNPHQVLSEAVRVLKPEGLMIVLGVNPWSPKSLAKYLIFRSDFTLKNRIGCYRLMDWLTLLKLESEFSAGFGLSSSQTVFRPDSMLTRSLAHLATSYAVKATKRTYTLIPIRSVWVRPAGILPGQVIDTPLMRK